MSENKSIQPFKNSEMVVLRNPVARAKFGLSLVQTKFLFEVLAYFKDYPEQRFARFYLRDYLVKLGVSSHNFKEYVRQMEDMRRRDINIPRSGDSNKLHFIGVSLFSSAEYMLDENGDGYVEIEVSDKLKPYFLEITKGEFFYYHILNTRVLRSTYSIKLYLLLKSYRRFGKLEIGLQELREVLEISPDEYLLYKNFKARVLETARLEMEEKNDICFEYEDIRRNRKSPIEKIVFRIYDNPNAKEILEKARALFAKSEVTLFDKDFVELSADALSTKKQVKVSPVKLVEVELEQNDEPKTVNGVGEERASVSEFNAEILTLFHLFDKEASDDDILSFVQGFDQTKVLEVLLYAQDQMVKGKTDIKNIYPYIVSGVRAGYGKGLLQKRQAKKEKEEAVLKQKLGLNKVKADLEEFMDSYEKAKNEKIREITSADPSVTDKAVESVKATFSRINPEVANMTLDDFRLSPMYREFVKKEIYEAYKDKFELIDRLFLPEMERLKQLLQNK